MRLTLPLRRSAFAFSSRTARGFLFCSLCLTLPLAAKADERQDYRVWSNFLKQQTALKLEPQAALDGYEGFLQAHSALSPNVAVIVQTYKAEVMAKGLKDSEGALALLDKVQAFYSQPEQKVDAANLVRIVRFKSNVLFSQRRWADIEPLLRDNWKQILEVGRQSGSGVPKESAVLVVHYTSALDETGKGKEVAPALLQALEQMPGLLTGEGEGLIRNGAIHSALVSHLLQDGRKEEALRWAKLQYMLCAFNSDSLERSTKLLAQAWAGNDNFAAIAAFGKAQGEPAAPNPLSEVKLPTLDAQVLQEQQARLEALKGKAVTPEVVSDLITLDLVAGRHGAAMQRARGLLQARVDSPEGAQEVARVFKAAHLNTLSANAFLSYLKGEGENPFPAFFEKHGQGNAAG